MIQSSRHTCTKELLPRPVLRMQGYAGRIPSQNVYLTISFSSLVFCCAQPIDEDEAPTENEDKDMDFNMDDIRIRMQRLLTMPSVMNMRLTDKTSLSTPSVTQTDDQSVDLNMDDIQLRMQKLLTKTSIVGIRMTNGTTASSHRITTDDQNDSVPPLVEIPKPSGIAVATKIPKQEVCDDGEGYPKISGEQGKFERRISASSNQRRGATCKFIRPGEVKLKKDVDFCHDFLNGKCQRHPKSCKFVHGTRAEYTCYTLTGKLPEGTTV